MRDDDVPNKTDAGRDEISSRALKLPNGLRSILLMVDGQRNAAQLRGVMAGLKSPDDALQQLQSLGLIAVPQSLAAAAAATIRESARPTPPPASEDNVPAFSAPRAPVSPSTRSGASEYSALYTLMSDTVREHLGLRGYFLQLKVERCTDLGELIALLPDFSTALSKARDSAFADEMERRFRALAQA